MIRTIYLGNFKGIGETQRIPIRPITLVFGPNSAGKSSLLHSLLLASHAFETGELSPIHTRVGGSIDLGGFGQFIHRHNCLERVTWGAELAAGFLAPEDREAFGIKDAVGVMVRFGYDLALRRESSAEEAITGVLPNGLSGRKGLLAVSGPHVQEVHLTVDGAPVLELGRCPAGHLLPRIPEGISETVAALARLNRVNRSRMRRFLQSFAEVGALVRFEATGLVPSTAHVERGPGSVVHDVLSTYTSGLGRFHVKGRGGWKALRLGQLLHQRLQPQEHRTESDRMLVTAVVCWDLVASLLLAASRALGVELNRLTYLATGRKMPKRSFNVNTLEEADPDFRSSGLAAWKEIGQKKALRDKLNKWLGDPSLLSTPYRLVEDHRFMAQTVRRFLRGCDIESTRQLSPDRLAAALHEAEVPPENHTITIRLDDLRTGTPVDDTDVGMGIAKVIPVLAEAMGSKSSLIAMEEPELHLHPRLQAELMDVLIQSALRKDGNTLVIETHSEHMVLRMLRRIRQSALGKLDLEGVGSVGPHDVAVLYVEPQAHGRVRVHELRQDYEGRFLDDWPDGFFPERLVELE